MNANTENLNALTTLSQSFPVKTLAEFKGIELESSQYLVRKIEKGTGLDSKGVVIPKIEPESVLVALENDTVLENVIDWYQEQIAQCCKNAIAAGAQTIVPSDYALAAVVEMLQARAVTEGRISKERLASWFDSNMYSVLRRAFTEKFGSQLDDSKIAEVIKSYKDVVVLLAKKEHSLDAKVISNTEKALALMPQDNNIVQYCQKKLKEFAPKTVDMLGL